MVCVADINYAFAKSQQMTCCENKKVTLYFQGDIVMGYTYNIQVEFDKTELDNIKKRGEKIYAFRAVKTSQDSGRPLVWQIFDVISDDGFTVQWNVENGAYYSYHKITPNSNYLTEKTYPTQFGQVLNIDEINIATVIDGEDKSAISIFNGFTSEYVCGISQKDKDDNFVPVCAFPLWPNHLDIIVPIEKVALIVATPVQKTATVYEVSRGPGIFIDLTTDNLKNRKIKYDSSGWHVTDGLGHAVPFDAKASMSHLLIDLDTTLISTLKNRLLSKNG